MVKYLFERYVDINCCNKNGLSFLYIVCEMNYCEIVEIFLENNVDVNLYI